MEFDLQRNLPAIIVALVLLAILVGVLLYAARVAQPSTGGDWGPPTGVAAMERKVGATIAMTAGVALLFLGYGLREPVRQVQAQDALLNTEIVRGIDNYTSLCFSCHGEKGQGAVVPGSNPVRMALPLNRPDLQPTDADAKSKQYDFIYKTIERGRPGTPMPTWGQTDGGPLMAEEVDNLTLMILNGNRTLLMDGKKATVWEHINDIIQQKVLDGTAKLPEQPQVESLPFYAALNEQEKQGVRVILQRGCGGCHTIANIPGAAGTIGPALGGIATRKQIAGGSVPNNSQADLAKWIQNPASLKSGTAMPTLGLSADEAAAAAAYLYTLPGP